MIFDYATSEGYKELASSTLRKIKSPLESFTAMPLEERGHFLLEKYYWTKCADIFTFLSRHMEGDRFSLPQPEGYNAASFLTHALSLLLDLASLTGSTFCFKIVLSLERQILFQAIAESIPKETIGNVCRNLLSKHPKYRSIQKAITLRKIYPYRRFVADFDAFSAQLRHRWGSSLLSSLLLPLEHSQNQGSLDELLIQGITLCSSRLNIGTLEKLHQKVNKACGTYSESLSKKQFRSIWEGSNEYIGVFQRRNLKKQ